MPGVMLDLDGDQRFGRLRRLRVVRLGDGLRAVIRPDVFPLLPRTVITRKREAAFAAPAPASNTLVSRQSPRVSGLLPQTEIRAPRLHHGRSTLGSGPSRGYAPARPRRAAKIARRGAPRRGPLGCGVCRGPSCVEELAEGSVCRAWRGAAFSSCGIAANRAAKGDYGAITIRSA